MKNINVIVIVLFICLQVGFFSNAAPREKGTLPAQKIKIAKPDPGFFDDIKILIYFYGYGSDYQKTQEQINKSFPAESYLLGVQKSRVGLYYEGNRIEEKTGSGNLSIERRNNSHMVWADYDFIVLSNRQKTFQAKSFAGIGAGMTLDTVTTKFIGEEKKDQGEYQWKSGGQLGLALQAYFMSLRFEGQVLTGANRNPNPGYAGFVRLGIIF
jgi:hypothetical protein